MGSYTVAGKRRIVVMIFGTAMAGQFKGRYATLFFYSFSSLLHTPPFPLLAIQVLMQVQGS